MDKISQHNKALEEILENSDKKTKNNITQLLDTVHKEIELSHKIINSPTKKLDATNNIKQVEALPDTAVVCCQGVEGAYSHIACNKIFREPKIKFVASFHDVTNAVERGEAEFGILPIENSTAGEVDDIIELLCKSGCYITALQPVKINHCISAVKGARLSDIKEVYSHIQALKQCEGYIKDNGFMPIETSNTAAAAKQIAQQGDKTKACISSQLSAEIYGLDILERSVQDYKENYTRFICISKAAIVLPQADTVAIALSFPNQPGMLNQFLILFSLFNLDLTKIQSMPIGGSSFNVRFHLDFHGSINDPKVENLLGYMYKIYSDFQFLGNYKIL